MNSGGFFILTWTRNLLEGAYNIYVVSWIPASVILAALLALAHQSDKTEFFSCLTMGACTFFLVYVGGRNYNYYSLIFSIFVPLGVLSIVEVVRALFWAKIPQIKESRIQANVAKGIFFVACLAMAFAQSYNTEMLGWEKMALPQYQFAEIILQKENPTLLDYTYLDNGFYTTTGIVPNCRFFAQLNMPLEEMKEARDRYVEQGLVDFVVANAPLQETLAQYRCVAQSGGYYLYELVS